MHFDSKNLFCRKVTLSDCQEIYDWENEISNRRMSFNSNLFTFEDHIKWFSDSLKSESRFMYIFSCDEGRIGLVRFDKLSKYFYESSIILNPKFRGLKLSSFALNSCTSLFLHDNQQIKSLYSYIRIENIASISCFINSGYKFLYSDNLFNYYRFDIK